MRAIWSDRPNCSHNVSPKLNVSGAFLIISLELDGMILVKQSGQKAHSENKLGCLELLPPRLELVLLLRLLWRLALCEAGAAVLAAQALSETLRGSACSGKLRLQKLRTMLRCKILEAFVCQIKGNKCKSQLPAKK